MSEELEAIYSHISRKVSNLHYDIEIHCRRDIWIQLPHFISISGVPAKCPDIRYWPDDSPSGSIYPLGGSGILLLRADGPEEHLSNINRPQCYLRVCYNKWNLVDILCLEPPPACGQGWISCPHLLMSSVIIVNWKLKENLLRNENYKCKPWNKRWMYA